MIEVAVVGAGAAGLVASRHLIGQGLRPSIFEAAKTVGGAWNSNNPNNKMWQGLTTNLSKHTCRFSELPWSESTPTFPTATDMNQYLDNYSQQFLDPSCFQFQCQITNIESLPSSNGKNNGYNVEWMDLATATKHSKEFGGVVVASGFFSKPHFPSGLVPDTVEDPSNIIHSSKYMNADPFDDQTVLVVGSSFSAMEISVDVAQKAKRVINLVPRVPWVVPRYVPCSHGASDKAFTNTMPVLPIDLALYRRSQDAPQLPEQEVMTPSSSRARHEFLNSIVGNRQKQTSLGIPMNWDEPPMVAISDHYLDYVQQGDIDVIPGRLGDANNGDGKEWFVETNSGERITLNDIDKVLLCTGYESDLNFLHDEILQTLDYQPQDMFAPMVTCWDTYHPSLPNLFFCGMYRGPYMGIMEAQGRLAAAALSGKMSSWEENPESLQTALEASERVRSTQPRAQFPHFDYVGFLDTLTQQLPQDQFPKHLTKKGDMIAPAVYQDDEALALQEVGELEEQVSQGLSGSHIPPLVMSALIGSWSFDREIVHMGAGTDHPGKMPSRSTERIFGTIQYSRPAIDHILYREDGFYQVSPTKNLPVYREYEYVASGDCLEIYFVEFGKRAHLFLSLKFTEKLGPYWVATSDHLCIKDLYQAQFHVRLDGLAATEMVMTYRVKGPAKDYESTTILTPGKPQ